VPDLAKNNGFDDSDGYYIYKTHGHVSYRYEILELLGKGSFGQVFKCKDHKTGVVIALKVIKNKKRFHQQAIVEVRVLDAIRKTGKEGTSYIVEMLDYFSFRNHICLSFELLSITLYDFMRINSFNVRFLHIPLGLFSSLDTEICDPGTVRILFDAEAENCAL